MDQIDILSARLGKTRFDYISSEEEAEIMVGGLSNARQRAESCTNIDLRRNNPNLRRVRHQGNTGWCFAFSMADLYTHHYRQENPELSEEAFSPIGIAIDYYFNDFMTSWFHRLRTMGKSDSVISNFGGLPMLTATSMTGGRGICLESSVRAPRDLTKHIRNIERIAQMREESFGSGEISAEESNRLVNQIKNCSDIGNSLHAIFPNMSWDNLSQVLLDTETSSFMEDLTNFSCQGNKRHLQGELDFRLKTSILSPSRGVEHINNSLERGNPIDFNYDSHIFDVGKDVSEGSFSSTSDKLHSSLIVGRRFNQSTRTCEYLIRNSWGSGTK